VIIMNVPGLVLTVIFYLMVLGVGLWGSMKSKKLQSTNPADKTEVTLLGNRRISLVVGIFTMTATYVGGGFIMATAEVVYNPTMGLTWAVIPLTASLSFLVGGLCFAKTMRDRKYVTMMDPLQIKYGNSISAVLSLALILIDVIWVTVTLISLGSTMGVILDLSYSLCIWISAAVAIIYTLMGGLYSVAYTDIIQLTLIFFSLLLCVPFVLMNPHSVDITKTAFNFTYQAPWIGSVDNDKVWKWLDDFLSLTFGNLGGQIFFQRILSASSSTSARITCFIAAPIIFIFGIPSVLIGAVSASTDWNMTTYGSPTPFERGEANKVLPIALQHLSPNFISIIGIAAVAAAAMSSTDSSLLSATSIFSYNIYKKILRKEASHKELQWVIRVTVVLVGLVGASLTFLQNSIMVFWLLGSDISYTIMFPQMVCVLFFNISNSYGCLTGLLGGLLLRLLSGEPAVGLPVVLHLPGCTLEDGVYVQHAPVRTICTLSAIFLILLSSYLASLLFNKGLISERWDVFKVKSHKPSQTVKLMIRGGTSTGEDDQPDLQNETEPRDR
ncbi:high-affinity choline transporter 1-like, partial [Leuresthes tenuis]|uniref:high-affinity choline transporter 1-like n=1 Tax=Leuresthes tenuis TaxID=355514 RepID=UPI003B50003E